MLRQLARQFDLGRLTNTKNMIKNMTMTMVNIYQAKARLSALLEQVAAGERVLICKRNQPVAELRRIDVARTGPRPIGLAKGLVEVPPAFFEPLPDDIVKAFEGEAAYPASKPTTLAVAEHAEPLSPPKPKPRRVGPRERIRRR